MNAISYSDINTYQRCPKKAYYRNVLGIQKKKRASNLWKGIEAHEILKDVLVGLQQGTDKRLAWNNAEANAMERVVEAKKLMFEDEMLDVEKEAEMILWLCEKYVFDHLPDEWEILHVEETFYITLDDGEIISFTPDLVVRDAMGFIWIVDHKTTSAVPDGSLPFGDTQALLYYTGVKALWGDAVKGFLFSRMRKKVPTEPRLTKTGATRVADLARIDTTYEVLRDFLQEKAPALLNDPMHKRRLAELRDGPERFYWKETVYVNEATEQSILDDVAYVTTQYKQSEQSGKWPRSLREDRGYMACSRCPYQSLCYAEMVGWDTTSILETEYEPADPKNPYEGAIRGED